MKSYFWDILAIGLLIHSLHILDTLFFSNRQIEDVPDYLSFLMVVLSLVNLLVCTVVKPFSAVFIAYAHATVSN